MSDRLADIKKAISHHLIRIEDVAWLIFEIDRLRADRSCCVGELDHLAAEFEDLAADSVDASTILWLAGLARAQGASLCLNPDL